MLTQALIPAAGRGIRAYPKTQYLPKPLLEIDGKTLLQRNIEILHDQLGIHDITVIIGYEREQIVSRSGGGTRLSVSNEYHRTGLGLFTNPLFITGIARLLYVWIVAGACWPLLPSR